VRGSIPNGEVMCGENEKRILLVDDDPDIRDGIAEALEDEGFLVRLASNGREALDLLSHEKPLPDLILLDMMMPVMDGWAFREEQQKAADLAAIPVVVFSAYDLPGDAASRLGVAGMLRKPVRLEQLLETVARTIAAR
jgi:CheY-like chemotaxis protein